MQSYPEQLTYLGQAESNLEVDSEDLELNHTHHIILDNGQLHGHLSDKPREQFVGQATQDGNCKYCKNLSYHLNLSRV